jgi:predicted transcriptional regulator
LEALRVMQERRISCLPVVERETRLVGIITERDLMELSSDLLRSFLEEREESVGVEHHEDLTDDLDPGDPQDGPSQDDRPGHVGGGPTGLREDGE